MKKPQQKVLIKRKNQKIKQVKTLRNIIEKLFPD